METFTVQPKFEGNALDFGMVIPTPSQPKLHEMPRDFFKHLAVYSIMKKREFPGVALVAAAADGGEAGNVRRGPDDEGGSGGRSRRGGCSAAKPAIKVLEAAAWSVRLITRSSKRAGLTEPVQVGSRTTTTPYSGDEEAATLGFYVQKKWLFHPS